MTQKYVNIVMLVINNHPMSSVMMMPIDMFGFAVPLISVARTNLLEN